MKSKKYMRILLNCLTVLGISCAAIGYLFGVMVSETIQSPTSIGVDIVFMVISIILAILSAAVIIAWLKFLLERYVR